MNYKHIEEFLKELSNLSNKYKLILSGNGMYSSIRIEEYTETKGSYDIDGELEENYVDVYYDGLKSE